MDIKDRVFQHIFGEGTVPVSLTVLDLKERLVLYECEVASIVHEPDTDEWSVMGLAPNFDQILADFVSEPKQQAHVVKMTQLDGFTLRGYANFCKTGSRAILLQGVGDLEADS